MKEMQNEISKIKDKKDFLDFLHTYIEDFKKNKDTWENATLETFLEGMESWVEDMDGYYENTNQPIPENVDWKTFADILIASKMHE